MEGGRALPSLPIKRLHMTPIILNTQPESPAHVPIDEAKSVHALEPLRARGGGGREGGREGGERGEAKK